MLHTRSKKRPVRAAVNILLALLMSFGVTAAVTPAAQAAPAKAQADCWVPSANGEGAARLWQGLHLRSGPYSACDNWGWGSTDSKVFLHCWTINSYGNVWWFVRIAGTQEYGWVSETNLWDAYESVDENGDGQINYYQC